MKFYAALALLVAGVTAGVVLARAAPPEAEPLVRIAELEIDPAQLAAYKALLAEEVEASVRLEPGVLMLHAVSLNDDPTQIRLLEVYADRAAYEAHLRSPQFLKYKQGTAQMVRKLRLRETTPILLCAKRDLPSAAAIACLAG